MGDGMTQSVSRGLEAGHNHKDLTLGDLRRLADALTVDLTDLLARAADPTPAPHGPFNRDIASGATMTARMPITRRRGAARRSALSGPTKRCSG